MSKEREYDLYLIGEIQFLTKLWARKLGGGVTLVLFVVRGRAIFRGTFFKPLRNYGYHFHNF